MNFKSAGKKEEVKGKKEEAKKRKLYVSEKKVIMCTFFALKRNGKNMKQNESLCFELLGNIYNLKRKSRLEKKRKMSILFCLEAKRVSMKRNEMLMKQNKLCHFISFLLDAKNLMQEKRKEANVFLRFYKRNARGKDLFSLRFSWKRKKFEA
jgi:hypothetical protein